MALVADTVGGTVDASKGDGVLMLLYRCSKAIDDRDDLGVRYLVMSFFLEKPAT